MIDELHVKNVALIKDATLFPSQDITVITGETGAGKTALLGALKLLLGERAESGMIREGEDELTVEGRVFLKSDDVQDGHIVKRSLNTKGRARMYLDGHMASVSDIASLIGTTCDLCGQHAHQTLLNVATHVQMIDTFGKDAIADKLAAYQVAFKAAQSAEKELKAMKELNVENTEKLEQERFVLQRIDEVCPSLDEYQQLEQDLPIAEHAEALLRSMSNAHDLLVYDDRANDCVVEALDELKESASVDARLGELTSRLESISIELSDIASEVASYLRTVDFDQDTLLEMQNRMNEYHTLLRAYGPTIELVLERRAKAQSFVDTIENFDQKLAVLEAQHAKAERLLASVAKDLSDARHSQAPRLEQAMMAVMARLEMSSSVPVFSFEPLARKSWTTFGSELIELMIKPGHTMQPRSLKKIASGGEMSRIMLVLKVVLGDHDKVETLVFDEVDAGIGGATAVALAEVLKDLSKTHQVLVVTHLPQVAVIGDTHYKVVKTDGDMPVTSLQELESDERVQEIARMLAGSITDESLAHARELLQLV